MPTARTQSTDGGPPADQLTKVTQPVYGVIVQAPVRLRRDPPVTEM